MTFESSELKFRFNKKGQLQIQEKEVWVDDIGTKHKTDSPKDTHDFTDIEEEKKLMLVNACISTLQRFLGSDGKTIYASVLDQDEPEHITKAKEKVS